MAASYPAAVKSFSTLNPGDTIQDTDIEAAYDEVAAIEGGLINGLAHDLKFTDATYDIGKSGATRPRDLFLSRNATVGGTLGVTGAATLASTLAVTGAISPAAGVAFPATQAASSDANTLDDYEENTWTPTIIGTGGQSGQAYSVQVGHYVKVGKLVTVTGRVTLSTLGTVTTAAAIGGLPFASENNTNQYSAHAVYFSAMTSSFVNVTGLVAPNSTRIDLYGLTAAATGMAVLVQANLSNTTDLIFTATYRASA